MDLISQLAGALGVPATTAQAVAGTVLGKVKEGLGDAPEAGKLDEAIPELGGWQKAAAGVMGGAGGSGGMLGDMFSSGAGIFGAAAGAVGGASMQEAAALVGLLGKLGITPDKAALVAPLVLNFLRERVDAGLLKKILAVAPMLAGGSVGGATGGIAGALGGLFGR